MLFGLIDRVSSAASLKQTLDVSSQRTRGIAQRVATATVQMGSGFALPPAAPGQPPQVNIEQEMTDLADTQLRFESAAQLLQKTYEQIRTSMRDR